MAFPKGKPKTGGRRQGSCNKVTLEIRALACEILQDEKYLEHLKARVIQGKSQEIEKLLYHYAFGKQVSA